MIESIDSLYQLFEQGKAKDGIRPAIRVPFVRKGAKKGKVVMMKVRNRQLLQELMNPEQTAAGQGAGSRPAADGTQEEELTARQLLKKELEAMYDPMDDMTEEQHAVYKNKLMAKIQSGKKLSSQEMNYLRVHDPAAYRMARRMEYKRMKLEQRLKHCRSKEEVEEVFTQSMDGISEDDPDREALMKTYQTAYEEFKKTMQYARLPETKKEAKANNLHGKSKQAFLEGKEREELEWDLLFEAMKEGNEVTGDGLIRIEEDATPWEELLDELPVMDVTG